MCVCVCLCALYTVLFVQLVFCFICGEDDCGILSVYVWVCSELKFSLQLKQTFLLFLFFVFTVDGPVKRCLEIFALSQFHSALKPYWLVWLTFIVNIMKCFVYFDMIEFEFHDFSSRPLWLMDIMQNYQWPNGNVLLLCVCVLFQPILCVCMCVKMMHLWWINVYECTEIWLYAAQMNEKITN